MAQQLSYWIFKKFCQRAAFPSFPPKKVSFRKLCKVGVQAAVVTVLEAWVSLTRRPQAGLLPCLMGLYQLARTASMSLTKFWARQIPKICSKAIPMKMPATMVKLSWSHFSNWGTQPFV